MNPRHIQNLLRRLDNVRNYLQTVTRVTAEVYAIEAELHQITQQLSAYGGMGMQTPYGAEMSGFGGSFGGDIGGGGRRRRRGRNRGQGIGAQGFGGGWQQEQQWGQQAFPFTAPNQGQGIPRRVVKDIANQVTHTVLNQLRQQGGSPFAPTVGQS